jgi:hypothetical protein
MNWKKIVRKESQSIRGYPGIYTRGLSETTKPVRIACIAAGIRTKQLPNTNLEHLVTFLVYWGWGEADKGMVRSDMSKPALIFFHCKSTHNKIHCQNFSS